MFTPQIDPFRVVLLFRTEKSAFLLGFLAGVLHRRVDTLVASAKDSISSSVKGKNDDLVKKLEGRMQTLGPKLEHLANISNAQAEVSTEKLNAGISDFSRGAFGHKHDALLDRLGAAQVRLDVLVGKYLATRQSTSQAGDGWHTTSGESTLIS